MHESIWWGRRWRWTLRNMRRIAALRPADGGPSVALAA
jgi:hypothetical protein